jgi:asparagine synthase (glutamine-hydrolysing)
MSAILAVFNRQGAPVEAQQVQAMLAATSHRALDGQHSWDSNQIILAHQHFWITPEEVGEKQPLVDEGGIAISSDARLDNRSDLIAALQLDEAIGSSLSDATLLLRAYRQWGVKCVEHLLGDFAFAIWDGSKRHLFIARDPLGTRGLYYYLDREYCLVASEIKSLLAHPSVPRRLNESRVAEYLANLWHNHEETFYQDIFSCPPAHCLLVSAGGVRKWRYWEIDLEARIRYRSDEEYAEHFLVLLKEAVRCRLRTTGKVGISLSGGLDSTTIAALAATFLSSEGGRGREGGLRGQLKSFSYVFDELSSCDERAFIQPVVERYQLDATYMTADDQWTLRSPWPVMADFVISDAYIWLPLMVMKEARQAGCRVLLNGHFGDALFAGSKYWSAALLSELRLRRLFKIFVRYRFSSGFYRDITNHALLPLIPPCLKQAYRSWRSVPDAYAARLHADFIKRTHLQEGRHSNQSSRQLSTSRQWKRYRSLMEGGWDQGVSVIQEMAHQHHLELATPFWDRRLVEYVCALPADQLGHPPWTKWLLRKAISDWLPDSVCWRPQKTTFYSLFKKGLADREYLTLKKTLTNPQIVERRFVRADWLQRELEVAPNWSDTGFALWSALSLELWLRRYWSNE